MNKKKRSTEDQDQALTQNNFPNHQYLFKCSRPKPGRQRTVANYYSFI